MAAFVESCVIAFARVGGIERKEKHSSCSAKAFLYSRRMPARAKSLGSENNQFAAGLGDCITTLFFARAHESSDASSARTDAGCFFNEGQPFGRPLHEFPRAFEWCNNRYVENCSVSVCEPFSPSESDARYSPKEAGVLVANICTRRIFFDVSSEGCELAFLFDDPIVPVGREDVARRSGQLQNLTWRSGRGAARRCGRVLLWVAVPTHDSPIFSRKGAGELPHQDWQAFALRDVFDFDKKVDVVWHYHEGRYFFQAVPFVMEGANNRFECNCGLVFDKVIWSDFRKRTNSLECFQGDHVIKRRFVVEIEETSHTKYFSII